ncbi:MAG TPA: FtsX-like permease family protein, partial [Chryseosolibacter sp.]
KIYRYVHRVKSDDELQSFAFTSATTGPALKERFSEVEDFTRIFRNEVGLMRKDSDIGFAEKNFAFADPNFLEFFSFPVRSVDNSSALKDAYSVILTPSSAKKYFGDADPTGQTLVLNGAIELVVKDVFTEDFSRTHFNFDFVASFSTLEAIKNHPVVSKALPASLNLETKGFNAFYTYLRLTSPEASASLIEKFPAYIEEFRGKGRSERLKPTLQSLESIHLKSDILYEIDKNGSQAIVFIYLIVGSLILITAIINYINISTAEFLMRVKNIGLKKILGINKPMLVFGHLVETMVMCGIAMVLAAFLAWIAIRYFNEMMDANLRMITLEAIWPFVLVYTLTVFLSGFLPAMQILRQDALVAFRGDQKTGRSSHYLRNSLVFLQLFVSFVLLAIALLIVRQTDYLLNRDTGFDTQQILVVNAAGMAPDERIALRNKLGEHLSVGNVSMCSVPPGEALFTFGITMPGAGEDEDRRVTFFQMFVDENFLQSLGLTLQEGRFFDANIPADSVTAFVVNQSGAAAIHDSVMTRLIELPNIFVGRPSRKTVVGVIKDFHFGSFHTEVQPLILEYNPRYTRYLLLRFDPSNVEAVVANLSSTWKEYAPHQPLDYYFMDEKFAQFYVTEQRTKQIVMIVSWIAIFLAALGIFGTSLFLLQQRTKEIGVRKLLGSAIIPLFILLFRPIFLIFLCACAVAMPVTLRLGEEWLQEYPYRIDFPISIMILALMAIFTVILLTVGSYVARIMGIQPARVLKSQ